MTHHRTPRGRRHYPWRPTTALLLAVICSALHLERWAGQFGCHGHAVTET